MKEPTVHFPTTPEPEARLFGIVNVARLPALAASMEFLYRSHPLTPAEEDAVARVLLWATVFWTFAATLLAMLGGALWITPNGIIVGTSVSFMAATTMLIWRKVNARLALLIFLQGIVWPVVFFFVYVAAQNVFTRLIVQAGTAALVFWFVEEFRIHYAWWLVCGPYVPREVRVERGQWYRRRFNSFKLIAFRHAQSKLPLPKEIIALRREELTRIVTGRGLLLIVLGCYVALPLLPHVMFAATLTLVVPPVVAWWLAFDLRFSHRYIARVVWEATVNWLTYEKYPNPAPGIHHSPAGIWPYRVALAALPLFLLGATTTPSLHFYPLLIEATFGYGWPQEVGAALDVPGSPAWVVPLIAHANEAAREGGGLWSVWAIFVGIAASLLAPVLTLGTALYVGAGPSLVRAYAALEETDDRTTTRPNPMGSARRSQERFRQSPRTLTSLFRRRPVGRRSRVRR